MSNPIGIGFRRTIAQDIIDQKLPVDFVELAPENWIDMGGYWQHKLEEVSEIYPITCHGLSLSIGAPDPVDFEFLKKIKSFIRRYDIKVYTEHLSYSKCDNAHLYDLLPIPFRHDAIAHISQKIKQVQDFLEMPLVLENVSYYTPVGAEMTESTFIRSIVEESGCKMLLDVNNVYVNAFNHDYDPVTFIDEMPLQQVAYMHMAGHTKVSDDTIIDTHGEAIIEKVYELFSYTVPKVKSDVPVLLERDFNIPEINDIQKELDQLRKIVNQKEGYYAA